MINEKKLIEGLRSVCAYDSYDEWADEDIVNEVLLYEDFEIIKLINNQPKVGEWIPVSERLPDYNCPVLAQGESTTISGGTIRMVGICHNGFWFIQNSVDTFGYPCSQYKVVAWMPLPEEYKEEKDV